MGGREKGRAGERWERENESQCERECVRERERDGGGGGGGGRREKRREYGAGFTNTRGVEQSILAEFTFLLSSSMEVAM